MTPEQHRIADLERQVSTLHDIVDAVLWPYECTRQRARELLERMDVEPTEARLDMLCEVISAAREEPPYEPNRAKQLELVK